MTLTPKTTNPLQSYVTPGVFPAQTVDGLIVDQVYGVTGTVNRLPGSQPENIYNTPAIGEINAPQALQLPNPHIPDPDGWQGPFALPNFNLSTTGIFGPAAGSPPFTQIITNLQNLAGVEIGMNIAGNGIQPFTIVSSISGNTITISNPAFFPNSNRTTFTITDTPQQTVITFNLTDPTYINHINFNLYNVPCNWSLYYFVSHSNVMPTPLLPITMADGSPMAGTIAGSYQFVQSLTNNQLIENTTNSQWVQFNEDLTVIRTSQFQLILDRNISINLVNAQLRTNFYNTPYPLGVAQLGISLNVNEWTDAPPIDKQEARLNALQISEQFQISQATGSNVLSY